MLKKLQTITWGSWSALAALAIFAGLSLYPVLTARGQNVALGDTKPHDGLPAMLAKAASKKAEAEGKIIEIKSAAQRGDGSLFIGTKTGLFFVTPGGALTPATTPAIPEIKTIVAASDGAIFVASKTGAYRLAPGTTTAEQIFSGDTYSLSVAPDGTLLLATKTAGLSRSRDQGANWEPIPLTLPTAPTKD